MDPAEYFAFVPLLFYGIALSDLLGQWRRFFDRDYFYLPYFATTVIFTELAIWNIYGYLDVVQQLKDATYRQYWAYLLQPMIFLLTVSALTPESEDQNTKEYFDNRMALVYGLMAIFIGSHLFMSYDDPTSRIVVRIVATALLVVVAVTRRTSVIYALGVLWFVGLLSRIVVNV